MITNDDQQQYQLNVDNSKLDQFDTTKFNVSTGSSNKRGVIYGTIVNDQAVVEATNEETPVTEEVTEVPEQTEVETEVSEEEDDSSPFTQQFEQTFGIKPTEAVELVNSLQAFRDEQTLMRTWGVDPVAYDERMSQVREFYNTLPEKGREQFNTVEGASAIWKHLQETGRAKVSTQKKTTTATSRVKRTEQKPTFDFKRSDITRMPKEEYQRKLPAIVKAFQTGRVLED